MQETKVKKEIEGIILTNFKSEWTKISETVALPRLGFLGCKDEVYIKGITEDSVINEKIYSTFSIYNTDKKTIYNFTWEDVLVYNFKASSSSLLPVGPIKLIITYDGIYENYTLNGIVFQNIIKYMPYNKITSINGEEGEWFSVEYDSKIEKLSCSLSILNCLLKSINEICKLIKK